MEDTNPESPDDLPFLVTQYVEQLARRESNPEVSEHLRRATVELASAFAQLGAFGTTTQPNLSTHSMNFGTSERKATFADAKRSHSNVPSNQLQNLVQVAQSMEQMCQHVQYPANLVQLSQERILDPAQNPEIGRTLQEAIVLDETDNAQPNVPSSLTQIPTLVGGEAQKDSGAVYVTSSITRTLKESSAVVRKYLSLKRDLDTLMKQKHGIERSIDYQTNQMQEYATKRERLQTENGPQKEIALSDLRDSEKESERVLAQLQRQLESIDQSIESIRPELVDYQKKSSDAFVKAKTVVSGFRDPFRPPGNRLLPNNRALLNIVARQSGMGQLRRPIAMTKFAPSQMVKDTRKSLLASRFSHSVTINTHLGYPIYCLRFDKSGRYFISGADDYLVKVFKLGAHVKHKGKIDPISYQHGAVLVCTLRGHAGVINDIDVSSDNSFLATASEDGDCRVWGLHDGRPIAVLRGHKEGANMVSWSKLTPFRLITVSADGFSRTWDIREAANKRYKTFLSSRPEYSINRSSKPVDREASNTIGNVPPPPIPERGGSDSRNEQPALPVQPLPLPAGAEEIENQHRGAEGAFVANDHMDVGVKVVEKFQHGLTNDAQIGPGTRSRRSTVKVICVARCPNGGHFATGCDDGICRIWADTDDSDVAKVDHKYEASLPHAASHNLSNLVKDKLLLTLKGHLGPITDLQYSNKGDRLLSASQKDAVVRIWSWSADPAFSRIVDATRESPTSHILLRLIDPREERGEEESSTTRRRPGKSASFISCDVATWTSDDSKILTSQCALVKQTGSDIVPGSQYIFIWDSSNGTCLMGLSGAHSSQCPVLLPHPTDPTIACSAGADGMMYMWNFDTCTKVYSHMNILEFGPVEAKDKGKASGYLDGSFSSDGYTLVLTDESGRLSVFDTREKDDWSIPQWMKEQYFANDYYELSYDSRGYCVERGSELAPHIAPRGVRCTHTGAPWGEIVNDSFKAIRGPCPVSVQEARSLRNEIRIKLFQSKQLARTLPGTAVSSFSPRTLLLDANGKEWSAASKVATPQIPNTPPRRQPPSRIRSAERLSSNFMYLDYSDMLADENEEDVMDSDDEEFEINNNNRSTSIFEDSDLDSDTEMLSDSELQPARASDRRVARRQVDDDSDDENDYEVLGTNNKPTGPFAADYDEHYFKISMSQESIIERKRFRRIESTSSYAGRKSYTPQVGDQVIYIPRAHLESITDFPSIPAPWQSWPPEADWPIVRCEVIDIRYRFPYKTYYKKGRHQSCVAKMTLKVDGLPEISSDRAFEWPKANFIAPTKSHIFEVNLFDSDHAEYIIPYCLYARRISALEDTLATKQNPEIEVQYAADNPLVDAELMPFTGTVVDHSLHLNEDGVSGTHLTKSGYRSVHIEWGEAPEEDRLDRLSPWEINIQGDDTAPVDRPRLTDDEKRGIRKGLALARTMDEALTFHAPVDYTRYVDYLARVEIPMDFDFIAQRLEADYYCSKASVVSDVKLIRDNCDKYNGPEAELTALAGDILVAFEDEVLEESERYALREIRKSIEESAPERRDTSEQHPDTVHDIGRQTTSTRRRSGRERQAPRAFYEELPSSARANRRSQRNSSRELEPSRPGLRRRSSSRTRSVLETAVLGSVPVPLDHSNRRGRNSTPQSSRLHRRAAAPRVSLSESALAARAEEALREDEFRPRRIAGPAQPTRSERAARRAVQFDSTNEPSTRREPRYFSRSTAGNEPESVDGGTRRSQRSRAPESGAQNEDVNGSEEFEDIELEDSEASSSKEERPAKRSRPRNQRSAPADSESEEFQEDEVDDEDSDDDSVPPSPRSKKNTRNPRQSNRKPAARGSPRRNSKVSYEDPSSSDFDDSESDAGRAMRKSAKGRGRTTRISASNDTRRPSRLKKQEDSDSASSESEEEAPRTRKYFRGSRPRRQEEEKSSDDSLSDEDSPKNSRGARATKRRRADSSSDDSDIKQQSRPYRKKQARAWAPISVRDISVVVGEVMDKLEDIDEDGIFSAPVLEMYPEIKKDYLKVVKSPMDFRTIREERFTRYRTIEEFHSDLLLVFQNCILYNGDQSPTGQLASSFLSMLDEIYNEVCKGKGIEFV